MDELVKNLKIPIKIKNCKDLKGFGLYSTKCFEEGEQIFVVKPLVAVLDEKDLKNACSNCFSCKEDKNDESFYLFPCKDCKILYYCCQECQENDWKTFHQYECAFLLSKFPKIIPGSIRMCMRLIFYGRLYPSSPEWSAIMELESHRSEIMSSEKKDIVLMLSKGIQNFTNEVNETLVLDLFCKIMINSFSLMTFSYDTIGTAIDPIISRINHSCYPNAVLVFDNNIITLRSLRKISSDQQITISYIDMNNTQKNRHDELISRYYFSCKCIRCTNPDKLENYFILKKEIPLDEFSRIETVINYALTKKNVYIFQALSILHRLKGWNSTIYPLNELHKSALTYFLDKKKFRSALCHGLFIHLIGRKVYKEYTSSFDPVYVVQMYLLVRLMIYQASENIQKQFKQVGAEDLMKYAYKLLYELVKLSYKSHGLSSKFSKKLQKTFKETGEDISFYNWGKHWQSVLKNNPEDLQINDDYIKIENKLLLEVKMYIEHLYDKNYEV
ncbi:hypothetical protein PORY_000381 [Pneumocystis oryctolagi]|uniref:Uncharacterized protein n=1 Tax=Pneumocystis oryctolagi TaxID=42067 RepID=A0ACB7CGU2_9ASCO|nr:hypothetical protein PORY_000381 [Pneumocystis oryctolagi]